MWARLARPTFPDPGRYWRIVDDLGVNILYTAPTALRALAQAGNEFVKQYLYHRLFIRFVKEPAVNCDTRVAQTLPNPC